MVALHVQRGLNIPVNFGDFLRRLNAYFSERDGMIFLSEQVAAYDLARANVQQIKQMEVSITNEKSALQWLRNELNPNIGAGPQLYSDIQPKFLKELHQVQFEDLPELRDLLKDNFLQDESGNWYIPNPEYQADLDALRQKGLLRLFNNYLRGKGKLKLFRSEAIRVGFSQAWRERKYDIIIKIAKRLPESVFDDDQQLLIYYHNASLRQSDQPRQESLL